MPPANPERRAALAAAAIEVLAERGLKGLTHRAVDAAADEPVGTTSRYFRTREALLRGVVEGATAAQVNEIASATGGTVQLLSAEDLVARLLGLVEQATGGGRARTVAMLELFLESMRSPDLQRSLADATRVVLAVLRGLMEAADLRPTEVEVSALYATVNGVIFTLLTTPSEGLEVSPHQLAEAAIRTQLDALVAQR